MMTLTTLATLAVVFIVLIGTSQTEKQQAAPPWRVNTPIVSVRKALYKKSPKPKAAALARVEYVGPELELMEWQGVEVLDDVWDEQVARWSTDNGRRWSPFQPLQPSSNVNYKGVTVWEGGVSRFHDPAARVLVEMWLRQIALRGLYNNFTYYRLSWDHGKTWAAPRQLRYEDGDEFDPNEPLKPSFLTRNHAYPGSNVLRHSNGTLIHCVAHANAPRDPENDQRAWRMGSLCFIGRWDKRAKDYKWTAGKRLEIAPDLSSRGLMEPEVAELKDKRALVIWRGSNTAKTPGRKWFSISTDGGMTLSPVQELKYDDGSRFYSPSSYHRTIRHSVTRKLYWVGNICGDPPSGNSPRYPLVIAEVDEKIPALKKNTVTVIDDRRPDQPAALQFSNFSLIENRETHDLELHLTAYGQDAANVYTADNYKYTLTFPSTNQAKSSGRLTLKLKQKLSQRSPLTHAFYVRKSGLAMIAAGGYSEDNGRTWTPLTPQPDFDSKLPNGYRREPFPGFVDPVTNRIIRIVNAMDTPNLDPNLVEPPIALKTYYLRYRVSLDGGKTYVGDYPIIQKGNYTEEHPFVGVWKGKNAIFLGDMGCQPIRTREGRILVPAQVCTLGPDGNLSSPGGGFTYTDVLVLIGKWVEGNKLEWEVSQRVEADPAASTRGMIEPTLAEMPDGRLLMVMRGSNGGGKDPEFKIPGHRWFSVSSDGGYHWTKPQPWTYNDGTRFFSPSSMSQLIRHSNGRYYWLGNISPTSPRGNSPRYPLVIGEVDSKSLTLIKESVITIDTREPNDPEGLQLSNFHAYEDRETGDIVLPMQRWKPGDIYEWMIYRIGTR